MDFAHGQIQYAALDHLTWMEWPKIYWSTAYNVTVMHDEYAVAEVELY